ncbi:MAG: CpXC domain-containing protein [Peptococcaceae bacterium]|jgi:hypothetical protein|nr:CpXC domain-containing protein [Peptococcaceae bacterium]
MNGTQVFSKSATHELECPECGHKQNMRLWDSVDGAEDFLLKSQIFDKTLHLFQCGKCPFNAWVEKELLYYDVRSRFMIYYLPEFEEDTLELDVSGFFAQENNPGFYLRIVTELEELVEKIRIFEDGLDDRAVELLKKSFLNNWYEHYPDRNVVLRYTQMARDDRRIKIHVFEPERNDVIALEFDFAQGYEKAMSMLSKASLLKKDICFLKVNQENVLPG